MIKDLENKRKGICKGVNMKNVDLSLIEFREFVKNKKCICFGAGLQGIRFINIFENWGKIDDIIAFVDNDSDRWGKNIQCDNYSYPIISIRDALKLLMQEVIIVITCADIINIRLQLNRYKELDNVPCFSITELAQKELTVSNYEAVIHDCQEPVIPKKLHYCWFGNTMPEMFKKNIESWRKMCPDYEIIEWNEYNYDVSKNRYTKQAYDMKKWGYVPDYIRLDLIYTYGGIYLDTDVKIVRCLDELLYQDGFASFDCSFLMNLGVGFGAKAGVKIIRELRDYYNDVEFSYKDGYYNTIPCMTHSYNVLRNYGLDVNDKFQKIGDINIYPMIFQGTCTYTRQMKITEKTFFLHYGTSTWLDEKNNKIKDELGKYYSKKNGKVLTSYSFL